MDESIVLFATGQCCLLACDDVVGLLERAGFVGLLLRLVLVFEQTALERLCWVEIDLLSHVCLLVL